MALFGALVMNLSFWSQGNMIRSSSCRPVHAWSCILYLQTCAFLYMGVEVGKGHRALEPTGTVWVSAALDILLTILAILNPRQKEERLDRHPLNSFFCRKTSPLFKNLLLIHLPSLPWHSKHTSLTFLSSSFPNIKTFYGWFDSNICKWGIYYPSHHHSWDQGC